jgi:hypothetical protein
MLLKGYQCLAIMPATSFFLYLSMVRATGEVTADPEVAVQNVFRQILNIRPPNELSSTAGKVFTPPKHMLELYRKYTAGGGPKRTTGSTVRSILPTKGMSIYFLDIRDTSACVAYNWVMTTAFEVLIKRSF